MNTKSFKWPIFIRRDVNNTTKCPIKTLEKCDTLGTFTRKVLFVDYNKTEKGKKWDTLGSWTVYIIYIILENLFQTYLDKNFHLRHPSNLPGHHIKMFLEYKIHHYTYARIRCKFEHNFL